MPVHGRIRADREARTSEERLRPRSAIVAEIDRWIGGEFGALLDDDAIDATVRGLVRASADDDQGAGAQGAALRRWLADCDRKLANYRDALGKRASDSVATWIAEAEADRAAAESELAALGAAGAPMTETKLAT